MAPSALDPLTVTALAAMVAFVALMAGLRLSRAGVAPWTVGWLGSLLLILSISAARRWCELAFVAPFSWIAAGRSQFVVFSGAVTMLLATLTPRLPRRRDRNWVFAFLGLSVSIFGLGPLVLPVALRARHEGLKTTFFKGGVCEQHDGYNCGPAAAVTALGWLGYEASIGDLAIRALTTPLTGTPPDLLCQAMEERYGHEGLSCKYRTFESVEDIPREGVTIVVIQHSFLIDHYVAVKEVSADGVIVGDPLKGLMKLSRLEFERRWRKTGIVLTRR